ncbi:hypothetical protein PIIN_07630 [Serendipita indica DSM 11827]|uniref:Uncharacterized protein n=1 Tax=Serendipita indica (strain DSM 11827) TaxID=1109443 RepID=G4TQT4_SERID|nr:hypothetical protein PIIN_07630 [Serendipita indica DSM 11827]
MTVCSLESQGSNQKSDSVQILARPVIDPKSSRAHEEATVSGKNDDDTKPAQIFEQKRETLSSEVVCLLSTTPVLSIPPSSIITLVYPTSRYPAPTRLVQDPASLWLTPPSPAGLQRIVKVLAKPRLSGNTNSKKRTLVTQFNHTRRHPPHLRIPTECCRFGRTTRELLAPRAHGRSHKMNMVASNRRLFGPRSCVKATSNGSSRLPLEVVHVGRRNTIPDRQDHDACIPPRSLMPTMVTHGERSSALYDRSRQPSTTGGSRSTRMNTDQLHGHTNSYAVVRSCLLNIAQFATMITADSDPMDTFLVLPRVWGGK